MPVKFEPAGKKLHRLKKMVVHRLASRRFLRLSLLMANLLILVIVFSYISNNSQAMQNLSTNLPRSVTSPSNTTTDPLDQLSAADVAVNIAQAANLPETTAVTNQADSVNAEMIMAPVINTVIPEPQVVATAFKSRLDIQTYTAVAGDSISSIAIKYNITSNSIEWSNGLTGNTVVPGTKLLIPPVNGIVYTVKQGDTVQSLAQKYSADPAQITAYNDAELSGLQTGEQILIPNGQPPVQPSSYGNFELSDMTGGSMSASYGGFGGCYYNKQSYSNYGYDCGYCTWWAAMKRATSGDPVPSNLGEAYSWAYNAARMGIPEGSTPQPGAVISFGSKDHVAYVESVGSDGSATISEMNHAGWDVEDTRTLPAGEAESYTYIY